MLKKLLSSLSKNTKHQSADNDQYISVADSAQEDSDFFEDEYSLLVKNARIVDYTDQSAAYNIDFKLGIYQDAYQYLNTDQVNENVPSANIDKVLKLVYVFYRRLIVEKFEIKTTQELLRRDEINQFLRLRRLFNVHDLQLPDGKESETLCLNLLFRPNMEPFIIIGKKPKGKFSIEQRRKRNMKIAHANRRKQTVFNLESHSRKK